LGPGRDVTGVNGEEVAGRENNEVDSARAFGGGCVRVLYFRTKSEEGRFIGEASGELLSLLSLLSR